MTYYFDMDGTIADFYGVENWLEHLVNENVKPYIVARPMIDLEAFSALVIAHRARGDRFCVVSWTAKNGSQTYTKAIRQAKREWIKKYFPNCFDEIHIIKYGTSKRKYKKDFGILFDDDENVRKDWGETSYNPSEILRVLAI